MLYVNGIAIGVIELKRSSIGIGEGIRQSLSNQSPEFNEWFFSTVQFVFAGNDTEGLRYGTIRTEEKYFLTWKEDEADDTRYKLDKHVRPDGWRGVQAKEQVIKAALFAIVPDIHRVESLFTVIFAQKEY